MSVEPKFALLARAKVRRCIQITPKGPQTESESLQHVSSVKVKVKVKVKVNVKVKQSRYRPGVAKRVPGS
jgi:hypothetical protein